MNDCLGIINLDEKENRMGELVTNRPLASVPIAARYRIIDFVLSNMTNSGIECIGIFAKNKSRSLMDHLTNGRPWDLHRKKDGLKVFNFGDDDPSYDDVHNFLDNIAFVKYSRKEYVLLSPSYMICNIDYDKALKEHKRSNNDITVIYKNVNNAHKSFYSCETLNIDDNNRVISIGENLGNNIDANISMEMYIMSTELFIDIVHESVSNGMYRKIKQFIHSNLDNMRVGSYRFDGYLSCINSLNSYYNANMDLLKDDVNSELFYDGKPIYTKVKDEPPTHYTESSLVSNSIIANGCLIEGEVKNCVISRRVFVAKNSKLENCVILQNSVIGQNASLENLIADKGTEIKEGKKYNGSNVWPLVMKSRRCL